MNFNSSSNQQSNIIDNKENISLNSTSQCENQFVKLADTQQKVGSFKFSSSPSLEAIRSEAELFVTERGWEKYHTPRNLLLALVGEVGELSEIFQWKGEVKPGLDENWTQQEKEHLKQELSDVFIYLVRLSQVCNVDLPLAVAEKIEHNKLKYPVNKFFGSAKKYNAE